MCVCSVTCAQRGAGIVGTTANGLVNTSHAYVDFVNELLSSFPACRRFNCSCHCVMILLQLLLPTTLAKKVKQSVASDCPFVSTVSSELIDV